MLDFLIRKKILLPLSAVLLVIFSIGAVFFLRSPLLIVTDSSFLTIYGPERLNQRRIQTSRALLRRVVPVLVSESAGPELVAFAVEGVNRRPWAVLFPQRYHWGASIYKENHPRVPVVLAGSPAGQDESGLSFLRTDTAMDLYRAGLCVPFFAAEQDLLFFSEGLLGEDHRQAFLTGLRSQDYSGEPIYASTYMDYQSYEGIGAVIMAGPAVTFLQRNLDIPVILFSWVDPAMSPRAVKIIFDDSPWALAAGAFRRLPSPGEEILVSSIPMLIEDRIDEKRDFRKLRRLLKEKY
ncbi:MAG: hypothetical protein FWH19_03140 [Treponema sp.]|nr:hypothetical protein [Treponema sp.]